MNDIGRKIRQLREERQMTQDELAKAVGYKSRASINKIELQRDIPLKKLVPIANALGVSPYEIMGWDEDEMDDTDKEFFNAIKKMRAQEKVKDFIEEEADIIVAYRNADDLTKQMVKKILGV